MIIVRYLTKEIFRTMVAVTIILLFIFMCNMFVKYLGYVASGKYASWVLLKIVILQVPILLALLLPLGLYLGILLGYGRLYSDSEMTVLSACGFSEKQLLKITFSFSVLIAIFVAILSLWLQPIVTMRSDQVLAQAQGASIIQTILPKRFQSENHGQHVYYVDKVSRNRQHMDDIFMLSKAKKQSNKMAQPKWNVMFAKTATQLLNKKNSNQYLVMENGHIYKGVPGQAAFQIIHFQSYGLRTTDMPLIDSSAQVDTMSTPTLIEAAWFSPKAAAELEWRISVPLSVFILVLLGLPLSHINPRQSKFAKIIPAAIIYIVYANMLFMTREWVSNGHLSPWIGMWWVHLAALFLALWLMKRNMGLSFSLFRVKK